MEATSATWDSLPFEVKQSVVVFSGVGSNTSLRLVMKELRSAYDSVVKSIHFTGQDNEVPQASIVPRFTSVRKVGWYQAMDLAHWPQHLAVALGFPGLQRLDLVHRLRGEEVDRMGKARVLAGALASSTHLTSLQVLDLGGSDLTDGG